MKKSDLIDLVKKNIIEYLDENNYELVDIEYEKEGPNLYLKIFIDKEGGVTIKDCEIVTKYLGEFLEKEDPIKDPYILQVSSPGLDRPLKKIEDYEKYTGRIIEMKLYKALDKQKEFIGKLQGLENNIVTIIDEDKKIIKIELNLISSCKLAVIF